MNKRILSLSIAAILGGVGVGSASAAVLAPVTGSAATSLTASTDGTGHILLVPYFSAQGGNATLLNIVNTDQKNGKAVKVRFRGASNSDDIFDFQVFLSPGDVWTANVSQSSTGESVLTTSDASCTRPKALTGTKFPTGRLPSSYTGDTLNAETREGYIEILNVADVPKGMTADQATNSGLTAAQALVGINPLFTATKHVSGVAPCDAALDKLATDPTGFSNQTPYTDGTADNGSGKYGNADGATVSSSAQALGLTYPTGGLFANWTIINVPNTTTYSGVATAVKATGNSGIGNLVFFPQTADPLTTTAVTNNPQAAVGSVATLFAGGASLDQITADPILRTTAVADYTGLKQVAGTPLVAAAYYDQPDLSTPYVGVVGASTTAALAQALTLTSSLAVSSVSNEYLTNPLISAKTDWVFSSPTRRYNTAFNYAYAASTGDGRVFTNYAGLAAGTYGGVTIPAFTDYPYFSPSNTSASGKQICVNADATKALTAYGQEEQVLTNGFTVSPGTVDKVVFCGETSIVTFKNTGTSVLSAAVARRDISTLPATDGWLRIGTAGYAATTGNASGASLFNTATAALAQQVSGSTKQAYGLPVIGYSAEKAVNGAVSAGVSGNFGLLFGHRFNR